MLPQLVPIVLVLGIFFFLVIRPQQRERRKREQMLADPEEGRPGRHVGRADRHHRQRHGPPGDAQARRLRPRRVPPERRHGARIRQPAPTRTRPDGSPHAALSLAPHRHRPRRHRGIAGPDRAARLARPPAPADQPRPGPPGRHPPGPRRRPRQGHRERARPHGRRPAAGAPEEGDRRPGHRARGTGLMVQLPRRRRPRRRSRRSPSFVEFDTAVARTRRRAGSSSTLKEKVITERRNSFVDQGLKVIRNRVDQFGVAEPDDPEAGREPHPRPAAGRPGSRPGPRR